MSDCACFSGTGNNPNYLLREIQVEVHQLRVELSKVQNAINCLAVLQQPAGCQDDRLTQYAQMLARARAIYASPQPAAQSEVNVAEDERKA